MTTTFYLKIGLNLVAATLFSCTHSPLSTSSPSPTVVEKDAYAPTSQVASSPKKDKQKPVSTASAFLEYRYFPSAEEALLHIVSSTKPRIIGFGEYHNQTNDTTVSALHRFSTTMLPVISSVTSDIIVEALVPTGSCNKVKTEVAQEIKEDTNRPEATEDETAALFRQSRAHGIFPHYLTFTCPDHQMIYGQETVDYLKLLELIGSKLEAKTEQVLNFRAGLKRISKPLIAVYGGAIHNDAHPAADLRKVSFAPNVKSKVPPGKFVEIDLVVPELMEEISFVKSKPWYPLFLEKVSKDKTLLIKQSDTDYIIVFPLATASEIRKHATPIQG